MRTYGSKKHHAKRKDTPRQDKFDVVHPNAAGIDIGSQEHYVAVPANRASQTVQRFGCYTADLLRMAGWLRDCGIKTVAMESTGVYWIPVYEYLERKGFEVLLVDARQTKNVTGRKTDVQDCQWIQRLHSYGLLSAAYRPSREIAVMRSYWRHRSTLVQACAHQIHLMQKALEQMNLQLHKAVTDIMGVTGRMIIEAILEGERDPVTLAKLRHATVKSSESELAKALEGTWEPAHLFALRQSYECYKFLQGQLVQCDQEIEQYMAALSSNTTDDTTKPQSVTAGKTQSRKSKPKKNQPHFDLRSEQIRVVGVDLTAVPGLDVMTVQMILTECGISVEAFPSEKHFTSWLGLCPNNRKTGGAICSRRTRKVNNRLATALRVAAYGMSRSQTAIGAYYRRIRSRVGAPKAITATARKLACIIYRMLKYGEEYVERGADYYEQRYKKRIVKNIAKKAKELGFQLLELDTGELVS
jgi:transposase